MLSWPSAVTAESSLSQEYRASRELLGMGEKNTLTPGSCPLLSFSLEGFKSLAPKGGRTLSTMLALDTDSFNRLEHSWPCSCTPQVSEKQASKELDAPVKR